MICKEDFVGLMDSLVSSLKALGRLEEDFGGVDLNNSELGGFMNHGDVIAYALLGPQVYMEENVLEIFLEVFWNVINGQEVELILMEGGTVIKDFGDFYDFWAGRTDNFPVEYKA